MKQSEQDQTQLAYNKAVHCSYFQILKQSRNQLATLERDEMRYCLEREDRMIKPNTVIHEIINPLIYLRLECKSDNRLAIHFGFEQVLSINQYSQLTTFFIRLLYNLTAKENTQINIEDCVRTDWMINQPGAMYEHVEEINKHHTFKLIKYKPQRRKLQAVA